MVASNAPSGSCRQCAQDGGESLGGNSRIRRRQIGQIGWGYAQRKKDRAINHRVEQPARQCHVLRVNVHSAVERQAHDVRGTGTPNPIILPYDASDIYRFLRGRVPLGIFSGPLSHGQREVHQGSAAIYHLLRRYSRVRKEASRRQEVDNLLWRKAHWKRRQPARAVR